MSLIIPDPVRDSVLGLCTTKTSNGSICNLPESLHDGRELDSQGYLHRFNQPINDKCKEEETLKFEDDSGLVDNNTPDLTELLSILVDVNKLINNQIIKMSQNGTKFLPGVVNTAIQLSSRMEKFLDEGDAQVQSVQPKPVNTISSSEQRRLETLRRKYSSKR